MPISVEPIEVPEPIRAPYLDLEYECFMANEYAPFVSPAEAELLSSQGLLDGIDFDVWDGVSYPWGCMVERKKGRRRTSCWVHIPIQAAHYPHSRELDVPPLRAAVRRGDAEALALMEQLIDISPA